MQLKKLFVLFTLLITIVSCNSNTVKKEVVTEVPTKTETVVEAPKTEETKVATTETKETKVEESKMTETKMEGLVVTNKNNPPVIKGTENLNEQEIVIALTSDMHGRIYPYDYAIDAEDNDAGYAKIYTIVKQLREEDPNLILLDNGDTLQDNSAELFNDMDTHPMIQAMNFMGVDAWTIGNHEFNFGKDFLVKNINNFKGSVISSNIFNEDDGSHFVQPYQEFVVNGARVVVIGITPPHVPKWEASTPEHFKNLIFQETKRNLQATLDEIGDNFDVLIGAFHLGRNGEYGDSGIYDLAKAFPEFTVIFGGHEHATYVEDVNGVKIIEPGKYGSSLAVAGIKLVKEDGEWQVEGVEAANLSTKEVEPDKEMLEKFKYVHEKSIADANTVVGEVTEDFIKGVDYITKADKVTTMPTAQLQDTAVINLINRVQKKYADAEISSAALFNFGSNLKKGPFKKKDVAYIYKYPNTLVGVNITGENLLKYMEWSASYYNTWKEGDITISFNPNVRGYNYDMFYGVNYEIGLSQEAGNRIKNATFNGKPIDKNRVYKLAVNNYRFGTLLSLGLVKEEDKYYDSYVEMQDAGRIRDLIIKYTKEEMGGKLSPQVANNWKIVGIKLDYPGKEEILDKVRSGEIQIPRSKDGRTLNVKSLNIYDFPRDVKIDIVTFNDFHGQVKEGSKEIGMAKLVGYVDALKKENPNVLVVSAGDNYQGTAISNLTYGAPVNDMFELLDLAASAIGNHEFDWGVEKIKEWGDYGVTFLASNIYEKATNKPVSWAKPYRIVEIAGKKIAFIGLATESTAYQTKVENVKDLKFVPVEKAAKEWVDFLMAGKAEEGKPDAIIALTHVPTMQNRDTKEVYGDEIERLSKVKGIDAIVTGHSHQIVSGKINGIPVIQAYKYGRALGRVELMFDKDNKLTVNAYVDLAYKHKDDIPVSQEAKLRYEIREEKLRPILGRVVGKLNEDLVHDRSAKNLSPLGYWASDIMRKATGTQIGLTNGGGLRRSLYKGDITMGDLYEVMPFDNQLVTMKVSGKHLKQLIDHGIDADYMTDGQFAGLYVVYNPDKPYEERVEMLALEDGTVVEDDKWYTLTTNDFILGGGDKYNFKGAKEVVDTYVQIRDVLEEAIKEAKEVKVPNIEGIMIPVMDYKVVKGDCLWNIIKAADNTLSDKEILSIVKDLALINRLDNPDLIYIDQNLILPLDN
jgi:2',3'-cyclic-nucleotide 2'-phosphodiesterase (5'-nucleotidase family)